MSVSLPCFCLNMGVQGSEETLHRWRAEVRATVEMAGWRRMKLALSCGGLGTEET